MPRKCQPRNSLRLNNPKQIPWVQQPPLAFRNRLRRQILRRWHLTRGVTNPSWALPDRCLLFGSSELLGRFDCVSHRFDVLVHRWLLVADTSQLSVGELTKIHALCELANGPAFAANRQLPGMRRLRLHPRSINTHGIGIQSASRTVAFAGRCCEIHALSVTTPACPSA